MHLGNMILMSTRPSTANHLSRVERTSKRLPLCARMQLSSASVDANVSSESSRLFAMRNARNARTKKTAECGQSRFSAAWRVHCFTFQMHNVCTIHAVMLVSHATVAFTLDMAGVKYLNMHCLPPLPLKRCSSVHSLSCLLL